MARCCGCVVLRKKHKRKNRSRGKRRRVDLTAGSVPASSADVRSTQSAIFQKSQGSPPIVPPPTPSPTATIPRHSDASQICQVSLVSSEGEYFDCLSDLSDANLEKPPSLHRSSSRQSVTKKSPSPTGNPSEEEFQPEVESGQSNYGFPTSLWDLLPWRLRPNSVDDDAAGPSEDPSEAADLMVHESSVSSSTLQQNQPQSKKVLAACLGMRPSGRQLLAKSDAHHQKQFPVKPEAGSTLQRLFEATPGEKPSEQWEPTDPSSYSVRSAQYIKTRQKTSCEGAFYDVIGADMFSFDQKQNHIAKSVVLPFDPYKRSDVEKKALRDWGIPPLLVVNMQMPMYQASLFGNTDGVGHSLVYYCVLKEGFNPDTFGHKAAVGLLQRVIQNGREQNSEPTRTRLKIIPRVVNVDEFAETGPLSKAEKKLLTTYNEKPFLTRPQHKFYSGPNYFEIDFDLHSYAFLARKALGSMLPRIHHVIFENAFVIQGNRPEELPEYMLTCLRLHRIDFTKMRYFSALTINVAKSLAAEGETKDDPVS